jgi:hypothetical protein
MSYPFNYPKPVNADVQIFSAQGANSSFTWEKPQGVSFVWFTLIGCGANGSGGNGISAGGGGGSGAVTNCLIPSFLIPDILNIRVPNGKSTVGATQVNYQLKSTNYTLLSAASGSAGGVASGGSGGAASTSNYFSAAGIFQSVAGQSGIVGTNQTASATTFLSGGAGANSTTTVAGNYGYSHSGGPGYFQLSPIIVGLGGSNFNTTSGVGGVGCGGGGNIFNDGTFGYGGPGMAVIISW